MQVLFGIFTTLNKLTSSSQATKIWRASAFLSALQTANGNLPVCFSWVIPPESPWLLPKALVDGIPSDQMLFRFNSKPQSLFHSCFWAGLFFLNYYYFFWTCFTVPYALMPPYQTPVVFLNPTLPVPWTAQAFTCLWSESSRGDCLTATQMAH